MNSILQEAQAPAIDRRLADSGLPKPMQDLVRKRFRRGEIDLSNIDDEILTQSQCFRSLKSASLASPGNVGSGIAMLADERDKLQGAMDCMISQDPSRHRKGFSSLRESWRAVKGFAEDFEADAALVELRSTAPRLNRQGEILQGRSRENLDLAESLKTSDWGEMLNTSMYKAMIEAYGIENYNKWRKLVTTYSNLKNFNTQRRVRYGGYGRLPTVAEQGTYQTLASPTDEEVTFAPSKRGGLEDLTWEMVLNDDLGAVRDIPKRLGLAAIMTLYLEILEMISGNAVIYDGTALFDAGNHGNTATGAALNGPNLKAAIVAMRSQPAYGNPEQLLGGVNRPKYLWVPNELEDVAFKLVTSVASMTAPDENATTPNVFRALYDIEVVVVDDFTDANDWFLTASPVRMPVLEVGFLNGRDEPELFAQDDPRSGSAFNADKITYKIRHVHGKAMLDYRSWYRSQG